MSDLIQAIVGGGAYVNIHTSANPAGEIRGQLVPVPTR
jgi:CHRD domain